MRVGGRLVVNSIANPAAGAEWAFAIPAGVVREILGIAFVLTSGATVINRGTMIEVADDGGNLMGRWGGNWPQPASLSVNYSAPAPLAGQTDSIGSFGAVCMPMPSGLYLLAGWVLRSRTANIQVGDQYSAIHVLSEEWQA